MADRKPHKIMDPEKIKRERQQKRQKIIMIKNKTTMLRGVIIILIFCLLGRVLYFKVIKGDEFEKNAVIQPVTQINEQVLTAQRGDILDRTGKSLAMSLSVYKVFVDVIVIYEEDQKNTKKDLIDETANGLFEVLEYPKEDFKALFELNADGTLKNKTNYLVIKDEVPYSKAKELREKGLVGVHLEENGKRVYPYNTAAAQTIGFLGGDGPSSNWGLENYYDSFLTGTDGRYFISYDSDNSVRDNEIEPIKGHTLVTTLDLTMQQFTDELVDRYGKQHGAKNAAIIIMKPDTGEIISMSEYPRFDNNFPSNLSLITDSDFASNYELLDDKEKGEAIYKVWKNFNISNTFEPGSIFKPVTVAAALEENVITNHDSFYCPGYKTYPDGTRVKCWIYDSTGSGHGQQNVEEALANSCNVAMMDIGAKMGREIFSKYQKDFGFGVDTGIDLPGEEDAKNNVYDVNELNEVELGTGSFGQGFNSTTLQDIIAFNAVINGGYVMKPYIVSDILDEDGNVIIHHEPEILRQVISTATSDILRKDLEATVIYGTGKNVAVEGYSIGGKTGTAEQIPRGSGKYALSFVGYIPVNNPQYIAIGVINEPNDYLTKHTSAVPMMHEVFEKMISYYNISSDKEALALEASDQIFMPDYSGNVVDAVNDLNKKGYSFQITGSGNEVYMQNPKKNQIISSTTNVFLFVRPSNDDVTNTLVEVPDCVGLELSEAKRVLEELGFSYIEVPDVKKTETVKAEETVSNTEVEENAKETKYNITKQMPTNGVSLPKGTQIRLIYK